MSGEAAPTAALTDLRRRHLRLGWWALAVFLSLGLLLEGFHGFKARFYLDVSASSRRLMWTLAHAHGSLLGLVNIAFAVTAAHLPGQARRLALASACLMAGTVLLPAGFFLGGAQIYGGDPGLGALLVPPGAVALIAAVVLTARATGQR